MSGSGGFQPPQISMQLGGWKPPLRQYLSAQCLAATDGAAGRKVLHRPVDSPTELH